MKSFQEAYGRTILTDYRRFRQLAVVSAVAVQFGLRVGAVNREIPFGFAQGRLSLRLKDGFAQDDAELVTEIQTEALPRQW